MTLKFVACDDDVVPVAWIGLLPISVTLPVNVLPGIASMVTFAVWPNLTLGMSVSSTSTSASMTDMSATVSSTVPGVVHRADDDRFTLFDVAAGDDAVDRRLDADLAQVVARALERGALLLHPEPAAS